MTMVCSKHLGSFLGFTFSDLHGFLSQQYFDPNEVLVLGSNGVNACKKSELKNIYGGIKEARKGAGLAVIEMFQVQIDAWPEGREKAKMSGWLKDAKDCPGYIKAADFVDELKKLAKPESTDTTRRDGVLINFDAAKAALKKAADDFEASEASLCRTSRALFFQGACDATSKLIDALQVQVDVIDAFPNAPPTKSTVPSAEIRSEHTQRMREELVAQINALQGHLNTALASAAPDQSISFQEVWTCMEAGHQKLAKLAGYTATVVPTNTKALPAVLSGATKFQRDLQKQMMDLLAKHQSDGSDVDISPEVAQALTKDIDQLKTAVTGQGRTVDEQAKSLLAVADQILGRLSSASLPTYAVLFEWSKQVATLPGYGQVNGQVKVPDAPNKKPNEAQEKQRDRLYGLMREVCSSANRCMSEGLPGLPTSHSTVAALLSELEAFDPAAMPPRLSKVASDIHSALTAAHAGGDELPKDHMQLLLNRLFALEGFPPMKNGSTYRAEIKEKVQAQINLLERWKREREFDPKWAASPASKRLGNEAEILKCLKGLDHDLCAHAQLGFSGTDQLVNDTIDALVQCLSWNAPQSGTIFGIDPVQETIDALTNAVKDW